ncbi:hypothetical protein B0H14DRAFT_3432763 [Mycena olivaceomarginata]|nr:hypothetical protein B0H14DRAFT_3432763 [Mycena olivaceomarginata]
MPSKHDPEDQKLIDSISMGVHCIPKLALLGSLPDIKVRTWKEEGRDFIEILSHSEDAPSSPANEKYQPAYGNALAALVALLTELEALALAQHPFRGVDAHGLIPTPPRKCTPAPVYRCTKPSDFHDSYAHALVSALDSVRILPLSHEMHPRLLRIHPVGLIVFERGRSVLSRIKHNLVRAQQRAAHLSTPCVKRAHSEVAGDDVITPTHPLKMLSPLPYFVFAVTRIACTCHP